MRLAPVVIFRADDAAAARAAAQSETTHRAAAAVDACAAFAGLLVEAVGGADHACLLAPRAADCHPAIAAILT